MSATYEVPAYRPQLPLPCPLCGNHTVDFTHYGFGSYTGACPSCGRVGLEVLKFEPQAKGAA